MIIPDYKEIEELAKEYNIIPVCSEIYADIVTPIALLKKISRISSRYYLFESIEGGERWGRYSFIGFNPVASVTCKDGVIVFEGKEKKVLSSQNPLGELRNCLAKYKSPKLNGIPPFTGGFVGYFSYSMIKYAEPGLKFKSSEFNDFDLMLFEKVIAYDHLKQKINIIVNMPADNVQENYNKALADIEEIAGLITRQGEITESRMESKPSFTCNVSGEEFCDMVQKAKEYMKKGEIY